ncbi:Serine phosphatase RsbU, regulator of sigma subunit [Indibacter alkaliphilus LW1]|uniref:Serine phosphatase RsbU, regulator of sigma subunit n=1 Tax=Indibacter alkaliphilus (strain CCUG 57479 / KCTC 22604 / LW1) TaxID=1189612 RepID=S2DJR4_INDAL|nr:GAF domain-containing SpoIIE family protein phosphatase [Indibacter alkaliphilus]EOZ92231.1 Serine phosphatase RsbU, regulator of sigma subunit [Indibacter alkaliphilus LW1]
MIKLPNPNIGKVSLLVAILTWLALLFVDITRIFSSINQMESDVLPEISFILEIIFFITVYLFYNYQISKSENNDFLNLIWRGASTGLIASGVSLLISFFYTLLGDSKLASDQLLLNFFYHVNFALITLFLISCSLLWKHLILYQKSKNIVKQWQLFEILMLISMFFIFFNKNSLDYSFLFGLVIITIFSISLSFNLKWIPYLTFKEKWKSILFLVIIIIAASYLFGQLLSYSESSLILINLTDNLFLIGLFSFVFIYSIFSFLVTLFNLPTSSVFEQKLVEAINFQRLSQSIKPGQNENQVLDILIDSSMSAAYADAGWLEMLDDEGKSIFIHERFIDKEEVSKLHQHINGLKPFSNFDWEKPYNENKVFQGKIDFAPYKSALVVPLTTNQTTVGRLYLVKEVKDAFNKEMINIISTFVGQACISVENYRLLNEAIKNERYKEELKIAQRVQRSLLPDTLHHDQSFDIAAFSVAADEVGGDYYETYPLEERKFAVIIGDVSGKGTSAAFNMSQMKGIFHSLVQLKPSPSEFIKKANVALGLCLEKNHFITTSFYIIDTIHKNITYSRAGHCPTLYFKNSNQECDYLSIDGMGLGILRSALFEQYVHEKSFKYEKDDVMLLFTDGIIEAKNDDGIEFGYERLKNTLKKNAGLSPKQIQEKIIEEVYSFIGQTTAMDDDYSLVVIKFN